MSSERPSKKDDEVRQANAERLAPILENLRAAEAEAKAKKEIAERERVAAAETKSEETTEIPIVVPEHGAGEDVDILIPSESEPKEPAEVQKDERAPKGKTSLTPEQQKIVDERGARAKALFDAFERGGGQPWVQEAKLKVKDLKDALEMHRKDPHGRNDAETIEWYEREIALNQRVVNGEKLVDVLDSMRTEEDKKRIEEEKEHHKNMRNELEQKPAATGSEDASKMPETGIGGVSEETEVRARGEATVRKENEDAANYFANRSEDLNKKAGGYGAWAEKRFRSLGETYNKLGWKSKLVIGAGLGLGAAAFAGVSAPLALAFTTGIGIQRAAGMASMYMKFEKHLQDTSEGTSNGLLGRREWYQKLFKGTSERQRKVTALIMAATYTGGMSYAIKEAVHVASESSYGEAVHEWLKHHYPFGHAETVAPAAGVSAYHAEAPSATPESPIDQPAVGVAAATAPEMPDISVDASDGHGYEYMMKRLWEQLQEKHLDASQYAEGSDIRQLLEADAASIDRVVHQLAADTDHGFFNADGTSVQIDPGAHMTIDADGDIALGDAMHENAMHASEGVATTPAYHPEEPPASAEDMTLQQPEGNPAESESDATPKELREKLRVMIDKFFNPTAETPSDMRVHTSDQIPTNTQPQPPVEAPAIPASQPEASHAPVTPEHLTVNAHGLSIDTAHVNSYLDPQGNHIIFGGDSLDEKAEIAKQLILKDHSAVVYFDSTRPGGFLGLQKVPHLSMASWVEGGGVENTGVQIVDDTTAETLKGVNIPDINDLAQVYKPN